MVEHEFNQMARDILESMFGFVAVDTSGVITYISRDYAASLGFTQEDCIGCPVEKIIPNSRLRLVIQRKKAEFGKYMIADGAMTGSICNRLLIYRDGIESPQNIVGSMGFGIITDSHSTETLTKELDELRQQNRLYQSHLAQVYQANRSMDEILGQSEAVQSMKSLIRRVANTAVSVCILGETGVGKELVANAIHKLSKRASKPFVKVNCAAIPKDLMESELFGYEPGSFTGASKQGKLGKFELANEGSLLLDEIGELPLNLQAKLLRVLQSNEIERIGGVAPIPINVRIICSTNRNLQEMSDKGLFRTDLYYRINTMEISVPPLRERPEDIPGLANYFIDKANHRNDLSISGLSSEAVQLLLSYSWPGNIRELEHSIERACVLCESGVLECKHFALHEKEAKQPEPTNNSLLRSKTNITEQKAILDALGVCRGNKTATAEMLGITRATLYSKLRKYNINI